MFQHTDWEEYNRQARAGLEYAQKQLSAEQISWLAKLPASTHAFDDKLFVVHSHPKNVDRYVVKGMFPSLSTYMSDAQQVLAVGHTHKQADVNMAQFDRHGWVVNPGSVGQPRYGNPAAAYALIDLEQPLIELHRVEYSIEKVRQAHEDVGLLENSAKRLRNGR